MTNEIDDDAVNTMLLLDEAVNNKLRHLVLHYLRAEDDLLQAILSRALHSHLQRSDSPMSKIIKAALAELLRDYMPGFQYEKYERDKRNDEYLRMYRDYTITDELAERYMPWKNLNPQPTNPKKRK